MRARPRDRIEAQPEKNKGNSVQSPEFNLKNFPYCVLSLQKMVLECYMEEIVKNKAHLLIKEGGQKQHDELANMESGLIETRVKEHNSKKNGGNTVVTWQAYDNYQAATNGRIWLIWDSQWCEVSMVRAEAQILHHEVKSRIGDINCFLTIIYGFNAIEHRRSLWGQLKEVAVGINKPWLVTGDFNAVLTQEDRLFGNPITYTEIQEYSECIHDLLLTGVQWTGDYYTWSNKQLSTERIYSRIDRAFGNHEWMMNWGHVVMQYDDPYISDHAPMLLSMAAARYNTKVSFKFFNVWAEHKDFMKIVEDIWQNTFSTNSMENIWKKLKNLRSDLRRLNNEEFKFIRQKIEKARQDLKNTQELMQLRDNTDLLAGERKLLQELEKWSLMEECALQQKAKATWIKLGDSNNKYFSALIKERTQRKQITELTSLDNRKARRSRGNQR
ncbi:PREDICTED: uncharacterized protein LOC109240391 [Nicotiana attenuata]|uniref:uncharacterized protein LOC109240391 n=1 Tax=Nicotiana attenuata TaxID=49451 RepID=UPI0009059CAB|nr:PREDICTED: uncharacterized protein LOC109240391 [Nicotiana attenuata]